MPFIHTRLPATALLLALAVALALALLSACGRDAGTVSPAPDPGLDAAPGSAAADAAITAGIRLRLARDATLAGLDIRVTTRDGRVLLRGIAPDTVVRSQAAELARTVAGVVAVDNDLSVQMPHP